MSNNINSLETKTQGTQPKKQRDWLTRTYREGDEGQIFEMRKAVHPERQHMKQQWLKWWHWMYKENPAGFGWIGLAEHNDRIIGHSAIIPVKIKIGREIVVGFQSINTMTHPDYRGQGIYNTLAKAVYDEAGKQGAHVGYRFPNALSYPIAVKKLSWFDVANMRSMIRVFKWENALKTRVSNKLLLKLCVISNKILSKLLFRAAKAPDIKDLTISQVSCFDERINEFFARVSSQFQIMVARSKDYLNWRFSAVPDVSYRIYIAEKSRVVCGYVVLRSFQREHKKAAVIYDLLAESEEITRCLLSTAMENCQRDGTDYVSWSGIANKAYIKAFRKSGFTYEPFKKEQKFVAYSSDPNISKEFLSDPENWLVQTGDTDIL